MKPRNIRIGSHIQSPLDADFTIWTEDPDLHSHSKRPWLKAYAAAQLGNATPGRAHSSAAGSPVEIPISALERHACIFGSTGSGKSRLAFHLISEQMRQGCSLVAIDPKAETINRLFNDALAAGIPRDRIIVLDPSNSEAGVPGWNPLLTEISPFQAATDMLDILAQNNLNSWGPRLSTILISALVLLATHGLSLFELDPFLSSASYRAGILNLPLPNIRRQDGAAAVEEAHRLIANEYDVMSSSEQTSARSTVLNKTRGLMSSSFLQALLSARKNTLDLASLWKKPGAVLVHLDSTALGDYGTHMLGGLLAHHIYRTAMRSSKGAVPVVFSLDEVGAQEDFIGTALTRILTVAREKNLRLLAASQHLAGMSDGLRKALLGNTALKVYFRLGFDDARGVSAGISTGTPSTLRHAIAHVAKRDRVTGAVTRSIWPHIVMDEYANPLRVDLTWWNNFNTTQMVDVPGGQSTMDRLNDMAAKSRVARLYVHAADTGVPVALETYIAGVPETEYWFDGPAPLRLVVSFPSSNFTNVQRQSDGDLSGKWAEAISKLPVQRAAVCITGSEPAIVKILDIAETPRTTGMIQYAGQSNWDEIETTIAWRVSEITRLSLAGAPPVTISSPKSPMNREGQHSLGSSKDSRSRTIDVTGRQPALRGVTGSSALAETNGTTTLGGGLPASKPSRSRRAAPVTIGRIAEDGSIS